MYFNAWSMLKLLYKEDYNKVISTKHTWTKSGSNLREDKQLIGIYIKNIIAPTIKIYIFWDDKLTWVDEYPL